MFENSLIESGKKIKRRSPWVTVFACLIQMTLLGVLVLFPLIYTEALPGQRLVTYLVAPPPPAPSALPSVRSQKIVHELDNGQLRTPTAIPKMVANIRQEDTPPPSGGIVGGVIGGVPGGSVGGMLGGVLGGIVSSVPAAVPKIATPQKIRVASGFAEGNLIHDVQPSYPPRARLAHIQGMVVLQAVIGKDGTIQNLQVVSGPPMLAQAALEAVKQWRYKPYYLNGEPVDVDTTINVNFTISET